MAALLEELSLDQDFREELGIVAEADPDDDHHILAAAEGQDSGGEEEGG